MHAKGFAVLALAMPALTQAAEWGLGATVGADGNAIYVPVKVSETLRVEPYVSYYDLESDFGTANTSYQYAEGGVGFFGQAAVTEQVQSYVGARFGYFRNKGESSGGFSDTDEEGFIIAPTIGGEFFFVPQFAVGVEAYVFYRDSDEDIEGFGEAETKDYGTGSRVVARFFFK